MTARNGRVDFMWHSLLIFVSVAGEVFYIYDPPHRFIFRDNTLDKGWRRGDSSALSLGKEGNKFGRPGLIFKFLHPSNCFDKYNV